MTKFKHGDVVAAVDGNYIGTIRVEEHNFQTGDVLEWQGCPVLVLGPAHTRDKNERTVTYLSVAKPKLFTVSPGQILGGFKVAEKSYYTKPLTEEETILYARMMLLHGK